MGRREYDGDPEFYVPAIGACEQEVFVENKLNCLPSPHDQISATFVNRETENRRRRISVWSVEALRKFDLVARSSVLRKMEKEERERK